MAADNDLRSFAARNIQQMAAIGSNDNVNLLVHLDIRVTATQKVTRRYYIKNPQEIYHMNANDPYSQSMDSGDPRTLMSAYTWAANEYPADNYSLILWNHGTGIIDPARHRIINPTSLFTFNPITHMLDLDRSIGFIDLIEPPLRGVCWDDSTGNYLNNQKLNDALNYICTNIIQDKFKVIGFDACLMAMVEVADIVKKYANIMVASLEVELGAGWNYTEALKPFLHGSPDPVTLAKNMVYTYEQTYSSITQDYTLSAIDLMQFSQLEDNINTVSDLLLQCLAVQKNNSVKIAIKASSSVNQCLHFEEPTYIDLYDFYTNIIKNIQMFTFKDRYRGNNLVVQLVNAIKAGRTLLTKIVLANVAGSNLSRAQGLSIYFPSKAIHASYQKTQFVQTNNWIDLITAVL